MEGYFQNYANFLYPYRWTQNVSEMQEWYGDTGLLFYNNKYEMNPFLTVRTADSTGLFVDDRWSLNKRTTINLGLRFDRMTTKYGTGKVNEPLSSPDEVGGGLQVLRDRASTPNIFDFKTWSPRADQLRIDRRRRTSCAPHAAALPAAQHQILRRFGPTRRNHAVTQMFEVTLERRDTNGDGEIDVGEMRDAAESGRAHAAQRESRQSTRLDAERGPDVKDQHTDEVTFNVERRSRATCRSAARPTSTRATSSPIFPSTERQGSNGNTSGSRTTPSRDST
jgi:hypothetical protein